MNRRSLVITFALAVGLLVRLGAQSPAPLRGDFDDASLREWSQPEYPPAARDRKLEGEVVVQFIVQPDGSVTRPTVTKSSDPIFDSAALAAVQRWTFASATVEGKPAASGMEAKIPFRMAQLQQKKTPDRPLAEFYPRSLPTVAAKLLTSPAPDYPAELEHRRMPGSVVLEFRVDPDGNAVAPTVLWASHAAFVAEAIKVLPSYRFEPAHQGPLSLASTSKGEIEFEHVGWTRAEVLANNGVEVVDREKFSEVPRARLFYEPVYSAERQLAGEEGTATVEFTVSARGATTDVLLREASAPEFGAALVAAVETWVFDPAVVGVESAEAKLVATHRFTLETDGPNQRVVAAKRAGGSGIGSAKGLDERLRPLWRAQPVYPRSLVGERPAGKVMIRFVIDREGRARLPQVTSASQPEFGWAAATAIAQWVFAPPMRGGQATDVEVSVPLDFAAPTD